MAKADVCSGTVQQCTLESNSVRWPSNRVVYDGDVSCSGATTVIILRATIASVPGSWRFKMALCTPLVRGATAIGKEAVVDKCRTTPACVANVPSFPVQLTRYSAGPTGPAL